MKESSAFTSPSYNISELSAVLSIKESEISNSIKLSGFTGFREYVNYQRLEYFKFIAARNEGKSIKEMMFICGFNSRTTFYRYFSEQYGISPTNFIESISKSAKE